MKVLFVNPSRAGQGQLPLNVPILISAVTRQGHVAHLFDFSDYAIFSDGSYEDMFFRVAPLDEDRILAERRAFYGREFGTTTKGIELKESDYGSDFAAAMRRFKPELVAISCLSVDFAFAADFLLPFKRRYGFRVVFGGIHSILFPEEVLAHDSCDFVCLGEGEYALVDLLAALDQQRPLESVKGIWFKKDGAIVRNEAQRVTCLADVPIPQFDHFDPIHFYRPFAGRRYKMLPYEISRGCPFDCSYCVNGTLRNKYRGLGRYHRVKEIDQSVEELSHLIQTYKCDFVRFWDEDFTSLSAEYIEKYSKLYRQHVNLPFLIYARVNTVTERKVGALKTMGCQAFAMGIESGNEFIRTQVMNRKISTDTIISAFALVKSFGIRVSAYNIIGLPFETRKTIFDTIHLNRQINPDSFSVTLLEPYRGTAIRALCEEQGLGADVEARYNEVVFVPREMTQGELEGLFRTFPLYVRFSEERFPEIRSAETDDEQYAKLKAEYGTMIR